MSELTDRVNMAVLTEIRDKTGTMICNLDIGHIAVAVVDAYRAEEKRKNCKHYNTAGTGGLGSDGKGWSAWFCQDCGASYDSRTPLVSSRERA